MKIVADLTAQGGNNIQADESIRSDYGVLADHLVGRPGLVLQPLPWSRGSTARWMTPSLTTCAGVSPEWAPANSSASMRPRTT